MGNNLELKLIHNYFGNHIEPEINYMQEKIKEISKQLQLKKEDIIKEKIKEKGFSHLLDDIDKKRFKKILVENYEDCEKWYADDGSNEGVLIVTFLKHTHETFSNDNREFGIKTELKYY